MPGRGKTLAEFQNDDYVCRQFANGQVSGVTPTDAAASSGVKSAVVGTAIGAAAGAAFDGGEGAAIGAGTGLLAGSAIGAGVAGMSASEVQYRYDNAYAQCMSTQGNRLPRRVAKSLHCRRRPRRLRPAYGPAYPPPPYYEEVYVYEGPVYYPEPYHQHHHHHHHGHWY